MVIIWSVLEVTYRLGFDRPAQGGWIILSYFVDALFFTDMLISVRTALVKRDGEVVANQKRVAVAYLKVRMRIVIEDCRRRRGRSGATPLSSKSLLLLDTFQGRSPNSRRNKNSAVYIDRMSRSDTLLH